MGPPPFGDGNSSVLSHSRVVSSTLQWGHRLSAMETGYEPAVGLYTVVQLQWGHRLSAMETSKSLWTISTREECFNGATAFRRWKLAV